MAFYDQLREEYELGWRAAGGLIRENEGAHWMRHHIIHMRFYCPENTWAESAVALRERPSSQMC